MVEGQADQRETLGAAAPAEDPMTQWQSGRPREPTGKRKSPRDDRQPEDPTSKQTNVRTAVWGKQAFLQSFQSACLYHARHHHHSPGQGRSPSVRAEQSFSNSSDHVCEHYNGAQYASPTR